MYVTTHLLDPTRQAAVGGFDATLSVLLPPDYSAFLREYGPGTYTGEVNIDYPDQAVILTTFGDYRDLWTLNDAFNEADLMHAVQLATTTDGDILCVAPNRAEQVFVLPRHSEQVIVYPSFWDAVDSLTSSEGLYFDPVFEAVYEQISLAKDNQLVDINLLHRSFQEQFKTDFLVNATTQPKYFFQSFGGWVSFDLVYRNTITIKYQQPFTLLVQPILKLLREQTD
jgi:hypothetical protein